MKTISMSNLQEQLGINLLTGESDVFCQRILCDLTKPGAALIRDWLGLPANCALQPSWNAGEGSVMLDRNLFPALVRFALLREGYQYVYGPEHYADYRAFNDSDLTEYPALAAVLVDVLMPTNDMRLYRNPKNPGQPHVGTRNVHAFSGRTE